MSHAIMLPPATPAASTAIVLAPPAGALVAPRTPLRALARRRVDLLRLAAVTAGYQRYNDSLARTA